MRKCLTRVVATQSAISREIAATRVGASQRASGWNAGECLDFDEQSVPGLRNLRQPFIAEQVAQRVPDDREEGNEQLARRAVAIVGDDFAGDQSEMSATFARVIENRLDR